MAIINGSFNSLLLQHIHCVVSFNCPTPHPHPIMLHSSRLHMVSHSHMVDYNSFNAFSPYSTFILLHASPPPPPHPPPHPQYIFLSTVLVVCFAQTAQQNFAILSASKETDFFDELQFLTKRIVWVLMLFFSFWEMMYSLLPLSNVRK